MRLSIYLVAMVIILCTGGCANLPFLSGIVVGTAIGVGGLVTVSMAH
ncbi:hypothetical protein [Paraburkholderia terrae]